MTTLTIHGSEHLATSNVLCCAACHGDIAYVVRPNDELAAECLSARCGATIPIESVPTLPLKQMTVNWSDRGDDEPPPPAEARALRPLDERISITALDERGLEYSAALDGWHIGFFRREEDARLAATNWALALQLGIVSQIGIRPQPTREAEPEGDDLPDDAPGGDCGDHGPYAGEDCPKCLACGGAHHVQRCPEIRQQLAA